MTYQRDFSVALLLRNDSLGTSIISEKIAFTEIDYLPELSISNCPLSITKFHSVLANFG